MAQPWTGIGHYTAQLMQALFSKPRPGLTFKAFAAAGRPHREVLTGLGLAREDTRVTRIPTRLRIPLTTRFGMPQLDGYFGPLDVVHGAFHLLPAAYTSKRIVTIFDLTAFLYPESKPPKRVALQKRLISHALDNAARVITLCDGVKQDLALQFGIDTETVDVVPGGIHFEDYQSNPEALAAAKARHGIPDDYFVYLGTLEPRKNLPRLIEAYAQVRDRRETPKLVLIGQRGWLDEPVFDSIKRLGLEEQVLHTGYIDRSDANALLGGARACLYPSLYEGFGLPVLESMAAGTAVLTSQNSAMSEITGDAAVLVEATSVDSIATGIESLLDEEEDLRKRVAIGREIASGYTWDHAADLLADAYRRTAS